MTSSNDPSKSTPASSAEHTHGTAPASATAGYSISKTPFIEPEPNAGVPGMTLHNGLPCPIVCVEIDFISGKTVRVTPQESVEQLRHFAAAVRKVCPPNHLVLEHPPAPTPLIEELALAHMAHSRNHPTLPKYDPDQPVLFI